ncbi:unnamed protein product, partial [Ilex paraguariensis]
MLQMGFQDLVEEHLGTRYKRLNNADEKVARPRKLWVKKMNGRFKGFRMGFQDLVEEHLGTRYKRLNNADEKVARPRKLWVKKMNGRFKGFRVS